MKIIYVRSYTPVGLLIRLSAWWGPWSHCGVLTPEGTVINARMGYGVVEEPLEQFLKRYSPVYDVVHRAVPDEAAGLAWARSQVGAGYDYGAIVHFLIGHRREDPRRYQCAEFVEWTSQHAGLSLFRRSLSRVTVAMSYMVGLA